MLIFLMAPAATIAFNILSFMLIPREKVRLFGDSDAFLIAMAAYQDFNHIGNATVLNRSRFTNGFFDRGIDAQIER
jgi:hypothetical protein